VQEEIERHLARAKELHGDVCPGLVLGTRLALAAMKSLRLDPGQRHRDLIVFVEIDRCMTDAVQAVTGCSLGHRNLKYVDYGKFATVLFDRKSRRAVRVSPSPKRDERVANIVNYYLTAPEEELVRIEEVEVTVGDDDLPGKPQSRVHCDFCGEIIMDKREVHVGGDTICRACADGAYYRLKRRRRRAGLIGIPR
jgi:formylmethanofuran dehydrogenase subunit E